jgi:predicted thioesterase
MSFGAIQPGLKGEHRLVVSEEHTARHLGSGGVRVLATPQMVLLMERASVAAVDHLLPAGHRTVGAHLDIRHIAPTPVGFEVKATAQLVEVDGRRLGFKVQVHEWAPGLFVDDEAVLVGDGTHLRSIVDVKRFQEAVALKSP